MIDKLATEEKVVGTKEVTKLLAEDKAKHICIAKDAEPKLVDNIIQLSKEKQVRITYVETMKDLGEACKIDVNAATAALLK